MIQLSLPQGEKIEIRRRANIKYLSIRMAPGRGVWVNVPYGVSDIEVDRFIKEKWDWINQNHLRLKTYEANSSPAYSDKEEIRTKMHRIVICDIEETKPRYVIKDRVIQLYIPAIATPLQRKKIVERFILDLYKYESERYLIPRIFALASKYHFTYRKVTFRNNRSNWGSCSSNDDISLNVQLMKLPDDLIDYVLLHELCHTIEKNHGPGFWNLMKKVCPDYKIQLNRLKQYHTRL